MEESQTQSSEKQSSEPKSQEQIQHESNKFVRERLAWLHYRLGSMQFFLEEAIMATEARDVLYSFCMDLQRKIEAVEPPPPKDAQAEAPKKPYVVDVPSNLGQQAEAQP